MNNLGVEVIKKMQDVKEDPRRDVETRQKAKKGLLQLSNQPQEPVADALKRRLANLRDKVNLEQKGLVGSLS